MEDCFVCIESYHKLFHKKIVCCYCSFEACHRCIQKYILSQIQDPHCMKCKKVWSREFIDERLSKQFLNNDLKIHRENILFEKEKNLLADTQDNVKLIVQRDEYDKKIKELEMKMELMQIEMEEIEQKKMELNPYQIIPKKLMARFPCIQPDCRGFYGEDMICGICLCEICHHCRDIIKPDHVCHPDTIKSVALLDKETKKCPSCFVPIFKINGCDQMWCTSCHMTFDWKSGHIVRGIIHNPHYHEYIEQHGTVPLQQRSYRFVFIPPEVIEKILHELTNELLVFQLLEVYRYTTIYFYDDLQKLPSRFDERINLDLRIQYLMNQLTEEEFKTKLQRRQKDIDKKIEYRDIGETYIDIIHDLFISFLTMKDIDILIHEIKTIIQDTNKAIIHLNKRYHSNLQLIRTDFI